MPVPGQIFRVDPRDLNKNIAIGVALPFNGTAVFNQTFNTKDQIKFNLVNLMLTNRGERVLNPNFGSDIKRFIFEFITEENMTGLRDLIIGSISSYVPEIMVTEVEVTPDPDNNLITLKVGYQIKLSGNKDNIIIQFT